MKSRRNWKRIAALLGGGTALAFVAVLIAWRVIMHREVERTRERIAEGYRAHQAAFFADQAALKPPFELAPKWLHVIPDAASTLNPQVQWVGKKVLVEVYAAKHPDSHLPVVPKELAERLASYRDRWVDHADEPGLAALEFQARWLDKLSDFDRWDLDTDSPAQEVTLYAAYEKPLPSLLPFLQWAKVRLLLGIADKTAPDAARAVRHAAALLHSTETVTGAAVALTLLDLERAAYDKVKATAGPLGDWAPVDAETTLRLRRVLFSYRAFASVYAPSDLATKAFDTKGPAWGKCAALAEGVTQALMVRWFLEPSMRTRYDQLSAALRDSEGECRLHGLRKAWSLHPNALGAFTGSRQELCGKVGPNGRDDPHPGVCMPWLYVHTVPGGREDIGHVLASMAEEGALHAYAKPGS